jgi:hypothetical protein
MRTGQATGRGHIGWDWYACCKHVASKCARSRRTSLDAMLPSHVSIGKVGCLRCGAAELALRSSLTLSPCPSHSVYAVALKNILGLGRDLKSSLCETTPADNDCASSDHNTRLLCVSNLRRSTRSRWHQHPHLKLPVKRSRTNPPEHEAEMW